MPRQRWDALFLVLVLMSLCPGCITSAVWSAADETLLPFTGIDGSARPGPGPREFLVARYGSGDDARLVRVPLDADGRPLPPFAWASDFGAPSTGTVSTVTAEQQHLIDAAAVPSRAGRHDPTGVIPADSPFLFSASDLIVMTAYRLTPDGRVHPVALPLNTTGQPPADLPKNVYTVLLPASRPVDPARQRLRRAQAVAITPLTLTADAATGTVIAAPWLALYALGFWAEAGFPIPSGSHGGGHGQSGVLHETHPHPE